jgi:phospholipid/cholesterol/gamma-HCH transport system substrate-binding protein
MQLQRNEIMTGVLVVGTVAVLAFLLILLGAPGLFRPLVTYKVYFDNASGIKIGAPVMLAGRKIGQVHKLFSPVSPEEDRHEQEIAAALQPPQPEATPTPSPGKPMYEVRVDVQVDKNAKVYRDARTRLIQLGLLGDMAIDITEGTESSGRAKDGEMFAGERVPDFSEAAAKLLEVIKPVASEASSTLKDLQTTSQNLSRLTDENSELNLALGEFKTFGEHLVDLSAPDGALSQSLNNIEKISTELTANNNIGVSLQNFRDSSERLKATMNDLGPAGRNIKDFSETVKTQPWRLIWPSTKKYPEEQQQTASAPRQTISVRKSTKAKPSPRPTRRSASRE